MTEDDLIQTLKQDCMPFLRQAPSLIYRGSTSPSGELLSHRFIREGRKARDNTQEFNDLVDEVTQHHTGFKMRSNGLFTTAKYKDAEQFGNVMAIFPKGNFRFAYSPVITDLYHTFFAEGNDTWPDELTEIMSGFVDGAEAFAKLTYTQQMAIVLEAITERTTSFFRVDNFAAAVMSKNEVIINNSEGYYMVDLEKLKEDLNLMPDELWYQLIEV